MYLHRRISLSLCLTACFSMVQSLPARAQSAPQQQRFDTAEAAIQALHAATTAKNNEALRKIFGPRSRELASGDEVQDARDLETFARLLNETLKLDRRGQDRVILEIGAEGHPFPVPIVYRDGTWFFDTAAGLEELQNRRIGENELRTIEVCRAYVVAQREYALEDHDGDGVLEFAQQLGSTPGQRDGLYWPADPDERLSPLGPLIAEAIAEGYFQDREKTGPQPYNGYVYRLLTAQGKNAPGGKFDYVINGNMVAGFALLAYPIEWGSSGVMTFLVNSNGKTHQQDLGAETAKLATEMKAYDLGQGWTQSED